MMLALRTPRTAPQASVIHLSACPPPLDALASGETRGPPAPRAHAVTLSRHIAGGGRVLPRLRTAPHARVECSLNHIGIGALHGEWKT